MNRNAFSPDEIEDIEDAAVLSGALAEIAPSGTHLILAPRSLFGVDYHLVKEGGSYVLRAPDGAEVGRVDRILDVPKLFELVFRNAQSRK